MGIADSIGRTLARQVEDRPIFVVGGSRSGTSVLLHALGKHRRIYGFNGEDPFLTDIGGMVYNLEFADERELAYYRNSLRIDHAYIYRVLRKLAYESAFGQHYGLKAMIRDTVKGAFNPLTKTHWCVKTFPSKVVADGLLRLYPQARFVMIHRNGMDVINSRTKFHGFKELDFRKQCEEWTRSINDFAFLNDMSEATTVRHMDLVENPTGVFRQIQDFLELDYDDTPASFTSSNQVHPLDSTQNEAQINVRAVMAKRAPVYESWSDQQRSIFKEYCESAMHLMGYEVPF